MELESGLDRLNAADLANLETVRAKVAGMPIKKRLFSNQKISNQKTLFQSTKTFFTIKKTFPLLGRYASGPCVLFKSDNARELLSACATLGFTSEPSLERRWPHNSVLEGEIRTIEECTRPLHIASGFQLHSGLWVHTVRYAAHTLNLFHPAVGIEGSRYEGLGSS